MLSPFNINHHNHVPPMPKPLRLASFTYSNAQPGGGYHAASGPGAGFVLPTPSGAARMQYPNQPPHIKATGSSSSGSGSAMSKSMSTPMPMSALGVRPSNLTKPEGIRTPSLSPSTVGRGR
ncbi:hypothetical protein EHS25_000179 [Saitozyma podzolica]|uniref:Uncharacterized protein n=1 Tax=Saitozyma podzolica TaxID=1890683 RepID=A0A427YVC4_9TREE|nr:hypothetical protein EHS25_000179 [Saitozyma podzolica]